MEMRARLLKGATALLYFGPLLAGLGGFGWSMVPSFVAIFVLWQMIVRPHQWPTSLSELGREELWVGMAAQLAVQTLLVVICFGIGRGLGGAMGALPLYSHALPLSVSFLSIPFSRLLWNPWKGDTFAESDPYAEPEFVPADPGPDGLALADRLLQPLQDMNGRISEADALRHLHAMAEHVEHDFLHDALVARVIKGDASEAIRTVLVVQSTDPALMDRLDEGGVALAMQVLPDDPELVTLYATRLAAAVNGDAGLGTNIPPDAFLIQRAERLGGAAALALAGLMQVRPAQAA